MSSPAGGRIGPPRVPGGRGRGGTQAPAGCPAPYLPARGAAAHPDQEGPLVRTVRLRRGALAVAASSRSHPRLCRRASGSEVPPPPRTSRPSRRRAKVGDAPRGPTSGRRAAWRGRGGGSARGAAGVVVRGDGGRCACVRRAGSPAAGLPTARGVAGLLQRTKATQ